MSDSRFHLEVKFEVYGKVFEWAPSLNWCSDPGECDERIARWFANSYSAAYAEFHAAQYEADAERRKKDAEAAEREQLSRLRKKYPDA